MAFLLLNWKWLLGAAAAVVLGIMLGITKLELAQNRADFATYQRDMQALATDAQAKARAAESANADLSAQLEEKRHAETLAAADKDAAVRAALAAARLRARQACVRGNNMPGDKTAAGDVNSPNSSGDALAGRLDAYLERCSRGADELAAYARECRDWAISLHHR